MLSLHAIALEKILTDHGLTIVKSEDRDWTIMSGESGKHIVYGPKTGAVHVPGSSRALHGQGVLRGSPETIAGILEGLVK